MTRNSEGNRHFYADSVVRGISVAPGAMEQVFRQDIFAVRLCLAAPVLLAWRIVACATPYTNIQTEMGIVQ